GESLGDADLLRAVYRRRAASADDAPEKVRWLEKLGELEVEKKDDLDAARETWKLAAKVAEGAGDDDRARQLYARLRKIAPEDHQAAGRLAELLERVGQWRELPPLFAVLVEHETDSRARVGLHLRLAHVFADRLGDATQAVNHAARAFELSPLDR